MKSEEPRTKRARVSFGLSRLGLRKIGLVLLSLIVIAYFLTFPALKTVLKVPDAVLPHAAEGATAVDRSGQIRVPLALVSKQMQSALLAEEDRRFYQHHGIDAVGALRAVIDNLRAGRALEGGSTISQQLAKNVFLDWREKTACRKLQQMVLAWDLENRYPKDRILEAYLNEVYFGNGAYGIETAARLYFGIHASELDLAQSAFLAGLVKAPSDLGSQAGRGRALVRQRQILQKLQDYGLAADKDVLAAQKEKLLLKV